VYLEISDQTLREVYHRAQSLREDMEEQSVGESQLVETTPSTSSAGIIES
jgi:hypothetical protein